MRHAIPTLLTATLLGACASTPPAGPGEPGPEAASCNADAVQSHIGHTASAEAAEVLLAESGARQLRWAPPRSALTMDYRPDRLTVSYDDDMRITQLSCG
ncbi:I78 family peptidase inhibitor [Aurantiacibacter sp. D1-12]|uniref:I78 family peptidase inhibitor n=1 Tax=Aurantiacibacter sp. D1-12 TaxID=2993658 RepID=UPI00237CB998|nr:I78 family peptidase inhibitor [Aurantiacibacter sp. D1-12]MDE1467650.1 I78 family peptidase inhibitor [Aurantiacibacter sp. D1-12]